MFIKNHLKFFETNSFDLSFTFLTKIQFQSKIVNMAVTVQTQEVREAILDATDRILSTRGYKKMTIDDLAHEVGIGKGSVYLHFTSKEEIVLSHIDRIVERLKEKLHKTVAENDTPENRLKKMLTIRVLHRFDSVQHYTVSISDLLAAIRPRLLERRQKYFAEESQIFAGIIVEGQLNGVFREDGDALEIAETLMTATNSLLPLSLSTEELGERAEIEEKITRLSDLLLSGVLKRA